MRKVYAGSTALIAISTLLSSKKGKGQPSTLTTFVIVLLCTLFLSSYVSPGYSATQSISMESVMKQQNEKRDLILIDVRSAEEFEKFRIPGSINIPLFALKAKTFLKSRALVLVNEGHTYKQLIDESSILLKTGFTVTILDGGLNQWRRKGGPLEGDVFTQKELNTISPQTFFTGKDRENWIVVDVSKTVTSVPLKSNRAVKVGRTATGNLGADHIRIPFVNDTNKEFIQKLKAAIKNHKKKDFATVLICSENGKAYEVIEKYLQNAGIQNVLYLEGGLGAYKTTFERQQINMTQAKNIGKTGKNAGTNKKSCMKGCP